MNNLSIALLIILALVLSFLIVAGMWWVVLWSFDFPIVFTMKQVIGVWIITSMFGGMSYKSKNAKDC